MDLRSLVFTIFSLAINSQAFNCVLLHLFGELQSAEQPQLLLRRVLSRLTHTSLYKLHWEKCLIKRVSLFEINPLSTLLLDAGSGLRRSRGGSLVPGWETGETVPSAGDSLPPPLNLLALHAALADVVAGVHLGLLLSDKIQWQVVV